MRPRAPIPVGPKEWMPARPLAGASLLAPGERERLERIERLWKGNTGNADADIRDDVLWACSQIRRLALLKPDEFDFPQYACLMNQDQANCFPLRYLRPEGIRNDAALTPEATTGDAVLLDRVCGCQVLEAVLAVRPYVRLLPTAGKEAVEAFRKCTVSLTVVTAKGERLDLLAESPMEEHLIGPDGSGVKRNPWSFARTSHRRVFPAIGLNKDQSGDPEVRYGIFLTKDDHLMFKLDGRPGIAEPVAVTAGIVAARYTVKRPGEAP